MLLLLSSSSLSSSSSSLSLLSLSSSIYIGDQADLETGFQQMKMRREMRAKYSIYKKWNKITLDSIPMKRERSLRAAGAHIHAYIYTYIHVYIVEIDYWMS